MLISPCPRAGHLLLYSLFAASVAAFWPSHGVDAQPQSSTSASAAAEIPDTGQHPLMPIGPGDTLTISVYDQPDMSATVYVSDDGTVPVALAGAVRVAGLSPAGAAQAIEKALRDGGFFKDPHVTIAIVQGRSQRVSVLGEVASPNRYTIDSKTTIFDLLSQAGGAKDSAASTIYLYRVDKEGHTTRYPIDMRLAGDQATLMAGVSLQGGDSIFVPKAAEFYIHGEVTAPAKYRIEPNMTIEQAIVRAGGVTSRGSRNRIEVKRKQPDGKFATFKGKPDDLIQPDDVLRVKESIF